jgi:hypothetical protein
MRNRQTQGEIRREVDGGACPGAERAVAPAPVTAIAAALSLRIRAMTNCAVEITRGRDRDDLMRLSWNRGIGRSSRDRAVKRQHRDQANQHSQHQAHGRLLPSLFVPIKKRQHRPSTSHDGEHFFGSRCPLPWARELFKEDALFAPCKDPWPAPDPDLTRRDCGRGHVGAAAEPQRQEQRACEQEEPDERIE